MRRLVFTALILLTGLKAGTLSAQVFCPNNINFELGNLSNWNFSVGTNNGSAGVVNIVSTGPLTNRHTLTSGTPTDYYGAFPIVDPIGGNYSLKLGNDSVNSRVEIASYKLTVPSSVNNYSLIYRYAVVFENPAHNASDQPFFRVRVTDSATGGIISCASFLFVSSSSLPGFSTSSRAGRFGNAIVYYKPWSTASLNLSGQAGKTLFVEFTAADCALGAHMGYGYVDVSCGLFAITGTTCNPTSPLTAPPGFQSYTWYNSNYSSIIGTGQTITIATPTVKSQYHVVLTPYPGYGCQDTLHTELVGSTLAVGQMPDTMLCNNSSITLNAPTVTGNFPPYTYAWTPATGLSCTNCPNPIASPSATTSYILTVTDSLGCTKSDTVEVKGKVQLTAVATNSPCFGAPGGTATASATSGTAPYSYSWNTAPPQTTATANALVPGTYTVTATDAKGCTAIATATVSSPTKVIAAILSKDSVSCNGGNNGKATATASGGIPPYTYTWNASPAQSGASATGLSGGTYIVTVTDSNGCTDTESVLILQPLPLVIGYTTTPVLCNGDTTGTATMTGAGGTPPYTYSIDARPYGTGNTFTGLNAGTHILHIKDARGCTKDSNIVVSEPAKVNLGFTWTPPLCNGASNGSFTISGIGGVPPYQYAIGTGSFGTSPTFTGLNAGTYNLRVRDANGCSKDSLVTVGQPTQVAVTPVATGVLCFGANSGVVTATGSGGTAPYTYAINNGAFGSATIFSGLTAGTYTVRVKDANGCTRDSTISVTQPTALKLAYIATQPLCNGAANGSVVISGSGGTAPYQFAINAGLYGTTPSFSGLAAGTYTLRVKDANGCTRDTIISIAQPPLLTATATKTNTSCFGGANGTAQVVATGGTAPYNYSWTGTTQTTANITGLAAGSYTATVTDAKGCTTNVTVVIAQPTAITATTSGIGPTCNNGSNGSATVSPGGGTGPYTYAWNTSPVKTTATASGLASGTYTVVITDSLGCTFTATATVPNTPAVQVNTSATNVSCFGGKDGTASASATNGNAPYTYSWNTSPVQTGANISGLSSGTYTVTVTSANGCIGTGTINVPEPAKLLAQATQRHTCPGFNQGSASVVATGGNSGYSYLWNTLPAQTTASISGLAPGTYLVVVTDSKGCRDSVAATVGLFPPAQVDAGADQKICLGSAVTLTATGAIDYSWTPAGLVSCPDCATTNASPTRDTIFMVVGTDANGCKDTDDVRVTVVQRVPVAVGPGRKICAGDSVVLSASGGVAWQWLPPITGDSIRGMHPTVKPVASTTYQVIITENECFKDTLTQEVEVVPYPTVELGPDIEAPIAAVVTLNAVTTNAVSIAWTPAESLTCGDCYNPSHTVRGKASFVAKVLNELGCPAYDTIHIRDICDEHYFYFANMFTPNGDGANDRFYPQGIGSFPVQHFMIYDRWGEIVFSANNIAVNDANTGWDGTFKGQALKPDVYVYVMDAVCEGGQKVVLRGDVTLIR